MKKIILVSILMFCIICSFNVINASSRGSTDFKTSSLSIKTGDTFIVTLSVKCDDGINGVNTTYSYDKDMLELLSANVENNDWVSMGPNGTIQVICNSTSKITSANIYVLTFKVKDNIKTETTTKITTTAIEVDSDVTESSFSDVEKSLDINIIPLKSNTPNENDNNNTLDILDNSEAGDNNTVENTNTTDNTITKKPMPQTGENDYFEILVTIILLVVLAGYFLIKIKTTKK